MIPDEIRRKRDELAEVPSKHVNWCDDQRLDDENMPGVGPGGDLNPSLPHAAMIFQVTRRLVE